MKHLVRLSKQFADTAIKKRTKNQLDLKIYQRWIISFLKNQGKISFVSIILFKGTAGFLRDAIKDIAQYINVSSASGIHCTCKSDK